MLVRWFALSLMAASSVLLMGCNRQRDLPISKTHPVKGTVTYNGSPVGGAVFSLEPAVEGGVPARAATDVNGNFELRTYNNGEEPDGAVPGEYVIEFLAGAKSLPADVNTRKIKVQITGEENDLQINIE